jgi:hypothetical protein
MNTRLKSLKGAAPRRLELIEQFQAKFGKSPLVDPDSMTSERWRELVEESLQSGEIPLQLRDRLGFVTSVQEG